VLEDFTVVGDLNLLKHAEWSEDEGISQGELNELGEGNGSVCLPAFLGLHSGQAPLFILGRKVYFPVVFARGGKGHTATSATRLRSDMAIL